MSKAAFGSISGVPWSTTPEAAFDVIMENVNDDSQGNVKTLEDENDETVMHLQTAKYREITMDATIKGATDFVAGALVDSVLTSVSDPDIPVPLIVISNGRSKNKGDWSKCKLTARYYGASFTTGTLTANIGTTTTGA